MSARNLGIVAAAVAVSLGGLASSSYAAIPWSAPNGSSPGNVFTFANGGSDNGLFGDPVVSDGGFTFFPSNFYAESSNGVAQTKRDRLFVTLNLPAGATNSSKLIGVQVGEIGDYSILGTGSVKVSGLLTLTILGTWRNDPANVVGLTFTDTMDADGVVNFADGPVNDFGTTPGMPISVANGSVDGEWRAMMAVPVPEGFEAKSLQLVLNNVLQATSGPNSTSFIEKKVIGDPGVRIRILVPEPATMTAMAGVGLLMLRRRSRNA